MELSDNNFDIDIISENVDMDVGIFNQRILHILERTINKIKVVSSISSSFKSSKRAPTHLSSHIADLITNTHSRYFDQPNPDLNSKQCCENIANMVNSLEGLHLENVKDVEDSPQVQLFVHCLQELRKNIEFQQAENITQERAREQQIRRAHLRNDQAKREIETLEQELISKKSDLNACIIGKNIVMNRHQAKILKIQKTTQEAIERREEESRAIIELDTQASQQTQTELRAHVEKCTLDYKKLLDEHLSKEKQLRLQRKKIENQLGTWMEKFDQDMSDKQGEEEQLLNELDEERKKYEDVQKKLDEQEEEYDELMQEKAAYEQEVLEQKLFIFILNRSARRIQRAFRAYKLRKMAKKAKKGKKGKGKRK